MSPQAFTVIDQNRDGIIDKDDLRETFAAMGRGGPFKEGAGPLRRGRGL